MSGQDMKPLNLIAPPPKKNGRSPKASGQKEKWGGNAGRDSIHKIQRILLKESSDFVQQTPPG